MSSWALLNSGDPDVGFGYWTPGPDHDGAMGWGFQPRQVGSEWNPATRDLPRGAWPICGEADHGLVAGIECARTVLFQDPVFGWTAYGGTLVDRSGVLEVIPRDGVRQRFSFLSKNQRLHVTLERDGFAREAPIRIDRGLRRLQFTLENRGGASHSIQAQFEGLPVGNYSLRTGGNSPTRRIRSEGKELRVPIHVPEGASNTQVTLALLRTSER